MFGYITPAFSGLSEEQKTRYKSYYCGLCRALNQQSGSNLKRLCLSHDLTFAVILLNAVYDLPETNIPLRCLLHPTKVISAINGDLVSYAADMNMLLTYYKCRDHALDDGNKIQALEAKWFESDLQRIQERYPLQAHQIQDSLSEIDKLETEYSDNTLVRLDALCNASGNMFGSVLCYYTEHAFTPWVVALGQSLGRFIYLMDAYDDLSQDIRRNRFNPLIALSERSDYEDFIQNTLIGFMAEATDILSLFPIEKDITIIQNVLYYGVWQKYNLIRSKASKEKRNV